jgi:hypothetical protein
VFNSIDVDSITGLVSGVSLAVFTFVKPFEAMQISSQLAIMAEDSIDHAELISWVYNDVKWIVTLGN